jgi:hypothetical protein
MTMNTRITLMIAPALILAAILAGCGVQIPGAGPAASQPITWPTEAPARPVPTPTPFPKITLAPTPTQAPAAGPQLVGTPAGPQTVGTPASARGAGQPVVATAGRVTGDALNLRQGPGTGYPVLRVLYPGDQFTALARDPAHDWLLVQANGQQGWVAAALVDLNGSVPSLPLATPALSAQATVTATSLAAPALAPSAQAILTATSLAAPALAPSAQATVTATSLAAPALAPSAQAILTATSVAAADATGQAEPQGRLVFQTSSGGAIMVINADGSGLRQLTTGIDPALSWDGQKVAFTRWQGAEGSVWVIDLDGSHELQVAANLRKVKGAEWSPDGRYIVVNYQHEGWIAPRPGCVPYSSQPNVPGGAYDIHGVVGPGGVEICFMVPPDEHWSLHTIDLAHGDQGEDLYGGMYAFRPAWDPTSAWRIVCEAGNGLLETSVNKDYRNYITSVVEDKAPAFSPDGQYIAFTERSNSGSRYDIYRINSDGSGRVRLTDIPLWQTVGPDQVEPPHNLSPAWSPDGEQIAFVTNRTGRWEIWAMAPDGSDQQPLFAKEVNDQIQIQTDYVDEHIISWH